MSIYSFTTIDGPSAIGGTDPFGINASGQIVGSSFNRHGFLLSGGTYTTIDDPSATAGTLALRHQRHGPDRRLLQRQRHPTASS